MRAIAAVLLALSLAACDARATDPSHESWQDASVEAPLASAKMLVQQREYDQAEGALRAAAHGPTLTQFSPERRREVIDLYAFSAWWGGDVDEAHWAYQLATQEPGAASEEWQGRLMSAASVDDARDAYAAFDHLRQTAPDQIRAISPGVLESVAADFRTIGDSDQAERQLADVLSGGVRDDPTFDLSPMWLHAAAAAMRAGDKDAAAQYARRIVDPMVMIELRADRRFDALVAAEPAAYDPHALAARELDQATDAARWPLGHMQAAFEQATALYHLGRYDEAAKTIDASLMAGPGWGDRRSLASDLVARKATILSKLGRDPEAIAMIQAQCAACGGSGAAQQLAHLLLSAGRPADALELLENVRGGMSGRGNVERYAMLACAYHGVGRAPEAKQWLGALSDVQSLDPEATLGGMLCAGSDAEVASTLASLLADPATRAETLGALQTYNEGPLPPLTSALRQRLARVAATPEIKAAIDSVGHVGAYDMPRYAILG